MQFCNSIDKLQGYDIIVVVIRRILGQKILEMAKKYPVIGIMGPRQSGKTTLAKALFPDYEYVSLETPDNRIEATKDPRGFLDRHKPPVILDELQNVPDIFSYLQEIVDFLGKNGQYIVTGSQNFVLNEKISQTLAGRIYLSYLPTLTLKELSEAGVVFEEWEDYAFRGSYPRVYDKDLAPQDWYPGYVQTYLERDMRSLRNVGDLNQFQTFMGFCAGRGGQELVIKSIADEMGLAPNTIRSWVGLLEISQLVRLVPPYYKNINKRLVKTPKLYFMDTGLMVYLLGITSAEQLRQHPLRGNIFENLVVSEILKNKANFGQVDRSYFLRDRNGNEVDYVEDRAGKLMLAEIKAAKTFSEEFLKGIRYWRGAIGENYAGAFVVYAGQDSRGVDGVEIINWKNLDPILEEEVV